MDCPIYNRGRWYHIFVENNAGAYKITMTDPGISKTTTSGNHLVMPPNFIVCDYKFKCDHDAILAATGCKQELYKYASGIHAITIPEVSMFNSCDVYVFGYFDR